jgi:hypothetical protein
MKRRDGSGHLGRSRGLGVKPRSQLVKIGEQRLQPVPTVEKFRRARSIAHPIGVAQSRCRAARAVLALLNVEKVLLSLTGRDTTRNWWLSTGVSYQ